MRVLNTVINSGYDDIPAGHTLLPDRELVDRVVRAVLQVPLLREQRILRRHKRPPGTHKYFLNDDQHPETAMLRTKTWCLCHLTFG